MSRVYVTFNGKVVRATDMAVRFRFADDMPTLPGITPMGPYEKWIPRSCCEDGETINEGDTDICIADWFCEKESIV